MTKGGQFKTVTVAALVALVWMASKAGAAQCGSTAAGFEAWKKQFADEARARGVSASTVAALMATNYSTATIAADRGQRSFHLSLDQFLAKRGGSVIVVARARAQAIQCGTLRVHPATLRRPAGAAPGHLGNGDGLREGARKSEHSVGCGYSRL